MDMKLMKFLNVDNFIKIEAMSPAVSVYDGKMARV